MSGDIGWTIDPASLREVVLDRAGLVTQLETASPADRVWLLRVLGHLEQSAAEGEALVADGGAATTVQARIRNLLLLGHTRSWQGMWDRAAVLHADALGLAVDTRGEAVARQHWGKCLFEQRRYCESAEQFDIALGLRRAADAAQGLVESSERALRRARELAEGAAHHGAS